ncbi:spore coat protein GerQ [Niallia oryzisoli]|uniref:spore coat protein GerQ n=1 Tax=Niallia oryzisoli TaxID=1737571 RepID=UPI0037367303
MSQQNYNPYGYYRSYPSYGNTQPQYGGASMGSMQPAMYPQQGAMPGTMFPPPGGTGMFPPAGAAPGTGAPSIPGMLPVEQSYIENILRLNKGKLATVYATFENNAQWNAKIFKGIIEAAGRDHLILSDPETGQRILLPMVYFDYATFDEELEYEYPFAATAAPDLATFSPR